MNPPTLLDEIVSEIRLHNPNATLEEIYEGISVLLSKEVLPEVIKNLSLPKFPSHRSVLLAKAKRTRVTRKMKTDQSIDLGRRRSIIQQVEYVRNEMGWDGADDLKPPTFIIDSSSLYYTPKINPSVPRRGFKKGIDFKKEEPQETEKETISSTFQKMPIQPEKNVINLSDTALRKIVSEPIFEEVFKNIEIQLRKIIASRNLKTDVDVVCKPDIEISSWNKCVLKIHPPPEFDFNARMNISTIFDITIRKSIKDSLKTADEDKKEYLKNLNRTLFVHVDL